MEAHTTRRARACGRRAPAAVARRYNKPKVGKKPAHAAKSKAHLRAGTQRRYPSVLPKHGASASEMPQVAGLGLGLRRSQPHFGVRPPYSWQTPRDGDGLERGHDVIDVIDVDDDDGAAGARYSEAEASAWGPPLDGREYEQGPPFTITDDNRELLDAEGYPLPEEDFVFGDATVCDAAVVLDLARLPDEHKLSRWGLSADVRVFAHLHGFEKTFEGATKEMLELTLEGVRESMAQHGLRAKRHGMAKVCDRGMWSGLFWDDCGMYVGCLDGLGLVDRKSVTVPFMEGYAALKADAPNAWEGVFDTAAAFRGTTIKELWEHQRDKP